MRINRSACIASRLALLLLLLITSACQKGPDPITDSRYQRSPENNAGSAASISRPVRQLHNQALAAINEDQYAQASDYLQRAIKIEPRNGWSWYYLADIHWRQGKFERCLALLERADAYAQGDSDLLDASAELHSQCQ